MRVGVRGEKEICGRTVVRVFKKQKLRIRFSVCENCEDVEHLSSANKQKSSGVMMGIQKSIWELRLANYFSFRAASVVTKPEGESTE